MCQLCRKSGHIVSMCYKRFDQQFQGLNIQQTHGHTQQFPANNTNSGGQQQQLTAFVATPDSVADSNWYFDSGATNHITSDASNLSSKQLSRKGQNCSRI
ncbi:hypothetical protein ACOSQ2_030546 [Xanthoceras sorbifolium]